MKMLKKASANRVESFSQVAIVQGMTLDQRPSFWVPFPIGVPAKKGERDDKVMRKVPLRDQNGPKDLPLTKRSFVQDS